jgi:hypothetical protein
MPKTKSEVRGEPEKICSICGGPGRANRDVCAACHGWWAYHSLQTAGEYGRYTARAEKAITRIQTRGTRRLLRVK